MKESNIESINDCEPEGQAREAEDETYPPASPASPSSGPHGR